MTRPPKVKHQYRKETVKEIAPPKVLPKYRREEIRTTSRAPPSISGKHKYGYTNKPKNASYEKNNQFYDHVDQCMQLIPEWEKNIISAEVKVLLHGALFQTADFAQGQYSATRKEILLRAKFEERTFLHEWGHAFDHIIGTKFYGCPISQTNAWHEVGLTQRFGLGGVDIEEEWKEQIAEDKATHYVEAFAESYLLSIVKPEYLSIPVQDFFNAMHREIQSQIDAQNRLTIWENNRDFILACVGWTILAAIILYFIFAILHLA